MLDYVARYKFSYVCMYVQYVCSQSGNIIHCELVFPATTVPTAAQCIQTPLDLPHNAQLAADAAQ